MAISKSKIFAICLIIFYIVILNAFNFKGIPEDFALGFQMSYPMTPYSFLILGGIFIFLTPGRKIDFAASEKSFIQESGIIACRILGWVFLLFFLPLLLIFLYKKG